MAMRKAVIVEVWAISDGYSNSFTVDLLNDPYWVGSHTTSGIGGTIQNWDKALATEVLMVSGGAESMSISGTVVTIIVPVKPEGHKYQIAFNVLFDQSVAAGPPINVDAPHAYGPSNDGNAVVGDTLTCTMGNWENMQAEPHSYAYEWIRMTPSDFIQEDTGVTTPDYTLTAADDGFILFCYLTATNAIGSAGESSNQITVTGGSSGQTQRTQKR